MKIFHLLGVGIAVYFAYLMISIQIRMNGKEYKMRTVYVFGTWSCLQWFQGLLPGFFTLLATFLFLVTKDLTRNN